MKLTIENQADGVVCVRAEGRISQRDVVSEQEPLQELLGEEIFRQRVLIDMSNVEAIDSSGINWLLVTQKKMREAGGRIVLYALSPIAKNVIRVLNLQTVFSVASDVAEARRICDGEPA